MTYAWFGNVYRKIPDAEPKRSDLACPSVISDVMPAVQSMASGLWYDSKSAIRSEYKAKGVTEIGNDTRPLPERKAPDNRKLVEKAYEKVKQGYVPVNMRGT